MFKVSFEDSKLTSKLGVVGSTGISGFSSLEIHVTSTVAVPLFPTASSNSNVNSPFSVNVYLFFPSLFVILTFSLSNVIVAVTGSVVSFSVLYTIVPTGATLSIQSTLIGIIPLLPLSSTYSKLLSPFSVNV